MGESGTECHTDYPKHFRGGKVGIRSSLNSWFKFNVLKTRGWTVSCSQCPNPSYPRSFVAGSLVKAFHQLDVHRVIPQNQACTLRLNPSKPQRSVTEGNGSQGWRLSEFACFSQMSQVQVIVPVCCIVARRRTLDRLETLTKNLLMCLYEG